MEDSASKDYHVLAQIPSISGAEFTSTSAQHASTDICSVSLNLSQRQLASLSRSTLRTHLVFRAPRDGAPPHLLSRSPYDVVDAEPTSTVKARVHFTRNDLLVRLCDTTSLPNGKAKRLRTVELWRGERCLRRVDVTEAHGDFVTDDTFGCLSLHLSGRYLLYTAERKQPGKEAALALDADPNGADPYESFDFRPSPGEKLDARRCPGIYLLDMAPSVPSDDHGQLSSATAASLVSGESPLGRPVLYALQLANVGGELQSALTGQATFFFSRGEGREDCIALTAYPELSDGRRLGLIGCTNRPAVVLRIPLPESLGQTKAVSRSDDPHAQDNPATAKVAGSQDQNIKGDVAVLQSWSPDDGVVSRLTPQHLSARSPRVIGDDHLVMLANERGGAHNDCASLLVVRPNQTGGAGSQAVTLVPAVELPAPKNDGFPGLFVDYLPRHAAVRTSAGERYVATTSIRGSRKAIYLVRLTDGAVTRVSPEPSTSGFEPAARRRTGADEEGELDGTQQWSHTLLATDGGDVLLAARSSPDQPAELLVGRVQEDASVVWHALYQPFAPWVECQAYKKLRTLSTSIVRLPESASHGVAVEAIVMRPPLPPDGRERKAPPCVLLPHGGPHGSSPTDFSPAVAALCLQGFTIVQPNYHGSVGFGQRFARSLIGRSGELDVMDCKRALDHLVQLGVADASRLLYQGGSHGGFIGAHLVGQFPDLVHAASLRNPVTDVASMTYGTDIPDWCFAELGLPFAGLSSSQHTPPSSDSSVPVGARGHGSRPPLLAPEVESEEWLRAMRKASPIVHVDAVRAKVLLLVGLEDKRVPPQQARIYFHALRGRRGGGGGDGGGGGGGGDAPQRRRARMPTERMLTFEGAGHALDTVEAELVGWRATLDWFRSALEEAEEQGDAGPPDATGCGNGMVSSEAAGGANFGAARREDGEDRRDSGPVAFMISDGDGREASTASTGNSSSSALHQTRNTLPSSEPSGPPVARPALLSMPLRFIRTLLALLLAPIRLLLHVVHASVKRLPGASSTKRLEGYASLDHLALNVRRPETEWLNMGLWTDTDDFATACEALARRVHQLAGIGGDGGGATTSAAYNVQADDGETVDGPRILDVGIGCGDSLLLLLRTARPSVLHGVTSLASHAHRAKSRLEAAVARQKSPGGGEAAAGSQSLRETRVECDDAMSFLEGQVEAANRPGGTRERIRGQGTRRQEQRDENGEGAAAAAPSYDVIFALDCAYHFRTRRRFFELARAGLDSVEESGGRGAGKRRGGCLALFDLCLAWPYPDVKRHSTDGAVVDQGPEVGDEEGCAATLSHGVTFHPADPGVVPPPTRAPSLAAMLGLRALCQLTSLPHANLLPIATYVAELRRAGFRGEIEVRDASADVFGGFSRFLGGVGVGEDRTWRGTGTASAAALRAFGGEVGKWGRGGDEGLIRGILVVAHTE